ncbi:MAG: YCF48-related protein [Bacteroidota bacterium]
MKKSLLLRLGLPLLLSIIVGHLSYAQSSWIWQNPLPQGNALLSVSCTDANTGTAVGYCGSIVRTTDGGANWAIQTSGTRNNLQSVLFTDANTGTAVGDSGTILRTTNGGATWTSQSSGTTNSLLGVHFTDANTGTAVGTNVILRTTNGGTNWTSQLNGTAPYLSSVSFTDADKGCISGSDSLGNGIILCTTDGGLNWTSWINQMQSGRPGSIHIYSICLTDTKTGTAVGETVVGNSYLGTIFRTTDGGITWTSQTSGTGSYLYSVCFTDTNTGTVVGDGGTILRTTDGGANWTRQSSGTTLPLHGVSFTDANTGTAVGGSGIILRTTNGGTSWTSQSIGTMNGLSSVSFTDANTGTAVGGSYPNGTVLHTTNGGVNWTSQPNPAIYSLYNVCFTDANTGTAVGQYGTIIRTTDGGTNWTRQYATSNDLYGVSFTDVNTGTVVGGNHVILRTTDGGETWMGSPFPAGSWLYSVCFIDANTGWAVGDGIILRTTDGGTNWTTQSIGVVNYLYRVCFTDANTGWAVGWGATNGIILHTIDGGINWTSQSIGAICTSMYDVSFTGANTGTIIGYRQSETILVGGRPMYLGPATIILQTTNGGASWTEQSNAIDASLSGVCFTDANNGTIVGSGGAILRMKNSGAVSTQPNVVLSSTALSFWKVMLNKYKETTITIKNEGGDTLRISNITSSNSVFSVRPGPIVVAPGQKSRDTLRFTPSAVGDAAATILVYSNSPSSPDTVQVYGNGFITGVTQLSGNNINYGKVLIGQSKDTTVTINNIGNDTLKISSISSSNSAFVSRTTVKSIPVGAAFTDTLHFAPTSIGTQAAALIITSSSPTSPDTIYVSGYCFGVPVVQFNAKTISFGKVGIGQYKDTTVMITNTGTDTLKISSIVSSDSIFIPKREVFNIAPGQSSIDTLRFSPLALGTDSAWITILSNAHIFPDTVKVSGIGDVGTKVDPGTELPKSYALSQNYPNPFNPSTTIAFALPSRSFVTLKIYDMLGREVALLASEELAAGNYTRQWNAASLSSGIYFYRLEAGSFIQTKKLILLK